MSQIFIVPPSCRAISSMYHIQVNIHTDGATTSSPYVDQQVTSSATQMPVSPRVTRCITTNTVLFQKGKGLCCHFQGCGHIRGCHNNGITQYGVCHCLPVLQMSRSEKTAIWADDTCVLHATTTCTDFRGNLRTSLTPCRDCFRRQ